MSPNKPCPGPGYVWVCVWAYRGKNGQMVRSKNGRPMCFWMKPKE